MSDTTEKVKTFFTSEQAEGQVALQSYRNYSGRGFTKFKQSDRFVTFGFGQKAILMYISKREAADYSVAVKLAILAVMAIFWLVGIWFTFFTVGALLDTSFSPVILAIAIIIFVPIILSYLYLLIQTMPRTIFLFENFRGRR